MESIHEMARDHSSPSDGVTLAGKMGYLHQVLLTETSSDKIHNKRDVGWDFCYLINAW